MGSTEYIQPPSLTVGDLEFIHDNSPVGDYFTIDKGGQGVQLHDVVTRQPLKLGAVPQGVLQTPELAAGIEYWREVGSTGRLTVQLVLGLHGSADDFRKIAREHGAVLTTPMVAFEMSWRSKYLRDMQPDKVPPEVAGPDHPGRRAFQVEELLWAHDNSKKIIPAEMAVDDESILATELKHLWDDIYVPMRSASDIMPAIRNAVSCIAERAYQATRQWTIVAQLGNWMMRLDKADRLPDYPVKQPLVIGSWHKPSAGRFESLGVPVEIYEISSDPEDTPERLRYGQLAMRAMTTGHVDMDLLRTQNPWQS